MKFSGLIYRGSVPRIILAAGLAITLLCGCGNHRYDLDRLAGEIYEGAKPAAPLPPADFRSDGCTCWPDNGWVECCVRHDLVYWRGGSSSERKAADLELRQCVSNKGYPLTGSVMYFGTRMGGVWWLPTSFRWGFGWDYPQSGPPGSVY